MAEYKTQGLFLLWCFPIDYENGTCKANYLVKIRYWKLITHMPLLSWAINSSIESSAGFIRYHSDIYRNRNALWTPFCSWMYGFHSAILHTLLLLIK